MSLSFLTQFMPIKDLDILYPSPRTQFNKLLQNKSTKLTESILLNDYPRPSLCFFLILAVIPFSFLIFFSLFNLSLWIWRGWRRKGCTTVYLLKYKKTINKYFKMKSIICIDFWRSNFIFVNQQPVEWQCFGERCMSC